MGVTVFLICAVLASLSAGVLFAYGICITMFRAFRIHAIRTASAHTPAPIEAALES